MSNKKFLKVLSKERESLYNFEKKLRIIFVKNQLQVDNNLQKVVANRILMYFFKEGKFKLFYTLGNLHKIAANMVLYMELQKLDVSPMLQKFIPDYQPKENYKKQYWQSNLPLSLEEATYHSSGQSPEAITETNPPSPERAT